MGNMKRDHTNFSEEEILEAKQAVISDIVDKHDSGEALSKDEKLIYDTHKKVVKEESSWFARNAWWLLVGGVIFLIRMCSEVSK